MAAAKKKDERRRSAHKLSKRAHVGAAAAALLADAEWCMAIDDVVGAMFLSACKEGSELALTKVMKLVTSDETLAEAWEAYRSRAIECNPPCRCRHYTLMAVVTDALSRTTGACKRELYREGTDAIDLFIDQRAARGVN
jgi:hypothetical protein